ncbi:MAG: preprotein translocase subunit SecE [Clostridia bacterium]
MSKISPEINNEPKEDNVPVITREELKQAKREAKLAKKKAADNVQPENTAKKSPTKGTKVTANAKPKLGKRIAKAFKEMISELKKVTWPKWKTVVTSTTVVIVVVLFFLVVLTAMDLGLGALLKLLTGKAVA